MTLVRSSFNPNIETLGKILELERTRGYDDLAVMGGLDRYLRHFKRFTSTDFSYASLSKEERKRWVERMLHWLAETPAAELPGVKRYGKRASPAPPRRSTVSPAYSGDATGSLDSPITVLKGVNPALARKFARLGVKTVRDMLYFFPRRHLDYGQKKAISELMVGIEQTIVGIVWEAREVSLGSRKGTEAIVGDETGNIRVVWFNQPYLAKRLRTNLQVAISGKVSVFKREKVFESPEWEPVMSEELTHTGRLVPLYSLTEGLNHRQVRRLVKEVVDRWAPQLTDFLPQEVKENCHLLDLPQAILQAHYPDNELNNSAARRRLSFDELLLIQLGVLARKQTWQEEQQGHSLKEDHQVLKKFLGSLPFTLTRAQQKVLQEILADLKKPKPMCRLLQGEVGSGKTVVATAALLMAAANGYQGAFMAPTEILAEQHFNIVSEFLSGAGCLEEEQPHLRICSSLLPHPFALALLTGSLSQSEKQRLQQGIKEGKIHLIIGTHALIQKTVEFSQLGLAVVDEQHRFGVMQRHALRQKGFNPHLLVMTATPIPRSLALTLYGDLDLSVIDELIPGRQVVKTRRLRPEQREKAYDLVRRKVTEGQQAFIICPLIEESESIVAKAAVAEYQRLSQHVFPELHLGLIHGRMPAPQKEETMKRFRAGELDILVATSVVEVGIDMPEATVMVVEGAERFGLTQLHQFRGRVGRGAHQSYCLLLAESPSKEGDKRLDTLEDVQDGFVLAEEDLRLRGPGEFFGTRQSGMPDLRMARLSDLTLLELARNEAVRLFSRDPGLRQPEHHLLATEMARLWESGGESS